MKCAKCHRKALPRWKVCDKCLFGRQAKLHKSAARRQQASGWYATNNDAAK